MNVASLASGDIVEVDKKGRRFHAIVVRILGIGATLVDGSQGNIVIRPLDSRITYRACKSREVVGIWKANKHTRARNAAHEQTVTA